MGSRFLAPCTELICSGSVRTSSVLEQRKKKYPKEKETGVSPNLFWAMWGATKVATSQKPYRGSDSSEMYARSATQHLSSTFVSALLFCLVLWSHAAEANVNAARVGHAAEANVNAARVGHALHLRNGELTCEDKPKWYKQRDAGWLIYPLATFVCIVLSAKKTRQNVCTECNTTFIMRILFFLPAGARSSKCLLLIAVGEATPSTIAPSRPVLLLRILLSRNTAHSIMLFLCPLCMLACNVHTRISIRRQPESCT